MLIQFIHIGSVGSLIFFSGFNNLEGSWDLDFRAVLTFDFVFSQFSRMGRCMVLDFHKQVIV